jgi:hypothetical protein
MNVTLTGLTPETTYEAQVKSDCSDPEEWSDAVTFTTPVYAQTITLTAGANYVSYNVEITLDELKAALVAAFPTTAISIKSKTQTHTYNPNNHRWTGSFNTFELGKMNIIKVDVAGEITLEGMPIDPSDHPVTITAGSNYISFPLNETMTPTDAFAGFAVDGDKIKSKTATVVYNRGRWGNQITELEPGEGYIYVGKSGQADRTLVFPSNSK